MVYLAKNSWFAFKINFTGIKFSSLDTFNFRNREATLILGEKVACGEF